MEETGPNRKKQQPWSIKAKLKESVTLPCDCEEKASNYKWKKDRRRLVMVTGVPLNRHLLLMGKEETRRNWTWMESQGKACTLEIQHLRISDAGNYRCIWTSPDQKQVDITRITLRIQGGDEVVSTAQSVTIRKMGEDAERINEAQVEMNQTVPELVFLNEKNETKSYQAVEKVTPINSTPESMQDNETVQSQFVNNEKIQLTTSVPPRENNTTKRARVQTTVQHFIYEGGEDSSTLGGASEHELSSNIEMSNDTEQKNVSGTKSITKNQTTQFQVKNIPVAPVWEKKATPDSMMWISFFSQIENVVLCCVVSAVLTFCCCIPVLRKGLMRNVERGVSERIIHFMIETHFYSRSIQFRSITTPV